MLFRSELLHPFAHPGQHACNNSQHCWRNNVGSCCIRLHTPVNTHATTPNIVGATMLEVVASVCTPLSTRMQQFPTLLAQQCWELLRPFARSLRNDLFFTFYHSVLFMTIANTTILIFFFLIKNIGTVIIIQLTKASTFLTITDVFSIAHLKVFQTPCINDDVSILLL